MRPAWILLLVLPLLALGLWNAQVAVRQSNPEIYRISPTRVQQIAQAYAQHLGQAGALVESEMDPGFTVITDGNVTQWSVLTPWHSPAGQVRFLNCKAREEHGQITILSTKMRLKNVLAHVYPASTKADDWVEVVRPCPDLPIPMI